MGENIAGCGAAESIEVVVEAMLDLSATVDSVTLQLKFNVGPFDVTAVEFDLSEPLGLPATVFETTLWDHEFYRKVRFALIGLHVLQYSSNVGHNSASPCHSSLAERTNGAVDTGDLA